MTRRIQPHIMCGTGDVAKYVLLPGDPKRVKRIASFFDTAKKVSDYRGFVTYTGEASGIPISACSTGIGCPTTAIAVEELMKIGAETFIRVGTTGSLQPSIDTGDIVVATSAVKWDGTSKTYAPIEYPAVADINTVSALLASAKELKTPVHTGIVASTDAFYVSDTKPTIELGRINVLSIEMECSTLFTLASVRGKKAGAILAVDGNLVKGTGKAEFEPGEISGELDPRVQNAIEKEIKIAIGAVKLLEKDHSLT